MQYPEIWNSLFAAKTLPIDDHVDLKVVSKNGHPFLLLPKSGSAASACLSLYPAQTPKARLARAALRSTLKLSLPMGLPSITLPFHTENAFVRFLGSIVEASDSPIKERFGILAGNPGGSGQRLIILLFDQESKPIVAVKVGLSAGAQSLILHERTLLESLPSATLGRPELRAVFDSDSLKALAIPYYAGESPKPDETEKVFAILASWLSRTRKSPIVTTELWQRLKKAAMHTPAVKALDARLSESEARLTIWHGDFAPWNIKAQRDKWIILDWERGELNGIPGWDWFHYETQTAILARKESLSETIEKIEALMATRLWRDYARMAEIAAFERELMMAYLAYLIHVIKPSEGLKEAEELLKSLGERWKILRA